MFGSRSVGIHWWYSLAGRYRTWLSECNDGDLSSFRFLRLHCPLSNICLTTYSKNWISRVLVGFGQHDCFFDWQYIIVSLTDRKVQIRSVCVWNCWKWKCVPLDIQRKLLVILLRLTLVFGFVPVFCKEWRLLKCSSFWNCGNFDAFLRVPDAVREDLLWWTNNVDKFPSPVQRSKSNVIVIRCFKDKVRGGMPRYYYWRYVDSWWDLGPYQLSWA